MGTGDLSVEDRLHSGATGSLTEEKTQETPPGGKPPSPPKGSGMSGDPPGRDELLKRLVRLLSEAATILDDIINSYPNDLQQRGRVFKMYLGAFLRSLQNVLDRVSGNPDDPLPRKGGLGAEDIQKIEDALLSGSVKTALGGYNPPVPDDFTKALSLVRREGLGREKGTPPAKPAATDEPSDEEDKPDA